MNEKIKQLLVQCETSGDHHRYDQEMFANLIIQEHIKLLRREWYDRNSEEYPEDISPRDIGVKVGQKNQIVVLIEKIKQYWNI